MQNAEKTARNALNPETGERYLVEYPSLDVVRRRILELDHPPEGITIKNTSEKLSMVFELSEKQKSAVNKGGKEYYNVFYHLVSQAIRSLVKKGKLEQPSGSGKPYFLIEEDEEPIQDEDREPNQDEAVSADESIDSIYQRIREELAVELLVQIRNNTPEFFEELVIDLLVAMGYGGLREDAEAVGRSHDGGIDGIINEDRLGLDVVYVQAKRWEANIGEPPIRDFVGALDGEGAQKGIFITTSKFNPSAERFAERSTKKIVLVDGEQLTQYMIDHNIGVATSKIYEIKRVDSDYFSDEK